MLKAFEHRAPRNDMRMNTPFTPIYELVNHRKCRVGTAHHQKQESTIFMFPCNVPFSVIARRLPAAVAISVFLLSAGENCHLFEYDYDYEHEHEHSMAGTEARPTYEIANITAIVPLTLPSPQRGD
jgi:hypothetical protein